MFARTLSEGARKLKMVELRDRVTIEREESGYQFSLLRSFSVIESCEMPREVGHGQ